MIELGTDVMPPSYRYIYVIFCCHNGAEVVCLVDKIATPLGIFVRTSSNPNICYLFSILCSLNFLIVYPILIYLLSFQKKKRNKAAFELIL